MFERKIIPSILMLALVVSASVNVKSFEPQNILNFRWSYNSNVSVSAIATSDIDGDGRHEIFAGLSNNSILVFDISGGLKKTYHLGNQKNLGKIYSLDVLDLDGGGSPEIIVGFGEHRISETFKKRDFMQDTEKPERPPGMIWKEKVLYQTLRNKGNLHVLDLNGNLIWNWTAEDSVRDVYVEDLDGDLIKELIVGVGGYGRDIYEEVVGSEENGTPIWNQTEEVIRNGSVIALKENGEKIWGADPVFLKRVGRELVLDSGRYDNSVRAVYAGDVVGDRRKEVLVGSANGLVGLYNSTNGKNIWTYNTTSDVATYLVETRYDKVVDIIEPEVKSVISSDIDGDGYPEVIVAGVDGKIHCLDRYGNVKWKQRLAGPATSVVVTDLEGDETIDIVVGSGDQNIYILGNDGTIKWKFYTGYDVYSLIVGDLNDNGLNDILVKSIQNFTAYELNEGYVKKLQADALYEKGRKYFSYGDYTVAMIYVQRAKDLYLDINDFDDLPKCNLLIKQIDDEIKKSKQLQADSYYDRALTSYGFNDYNTSMLYINLALEIYTQINNTNSISKCEKLVDQINRDILIEKKLRADSYYNQALNYHSFGNYTATLENLRTAKKMYDEVGDLNGTIKVELFMLKMADSHYSKAESYFKSFNYETALTYAKMSRELYEETKDYNGTVKSELLVWEIEEKMKLTPPQDGDKTSYVLYIIGLLIVLAVVFFFTRIRRREKAAFDAVVE